MATVDKFTTTSASYPEPDFGVLGQATKDISRLNIFKTRTFPALQEKAQIVTDRVFAMHDLIGSELIALSTNVQSLDLMDTVQQIAEIDEELKVGARDALTEARGDLVGFISDSLGTSATKFSESAGKVQSKSDDIGEVVIVERAEDELARYQSRREALEKAIAEKEAEEKALREDRAKIIAGQDVIREKNIADIFKDYIPSGKDLKKLDLENPEAEAIEQATELLKKMLGTVSEGFKYSDLADARKKLDAKIDEVVKEKRALQSDLAADDDVLGDLNGVMDIHEKRSLVIGEAEKLSTAWMRFSDEVENLDGSQVSEVNILVRKMDDYLTRCIAKRNQVVVK
jgi:hypothetical protein